MMKRLSLLLIVCLVAGCGDDNPAKPDTSPKPDMQKADAGVDAPPADRGVDAPADAPGDTTADSSSDAPAGDTSVDSTRDVGPDGAADQSLLADQGTLTPLNSVASCNPASANQNIAASVYYFRAAQTFTASQSGVLEAIDFAFDSEGKIVNQEMQLRAVASNGQPTGALLASRPVKGFFLRTVVHRLDFSSSNVQLTQGTTYGLVLIDKNPISGTGKRLQWWGRQNCASAGAVALFKSLNQQALTWGSPTTTSAVSFNVGIKAAASDAGAD